ncbi:MAG TPA: cytochrome c maturation protein CcmE [Nitrospirae bacterium]|nr:cytochrome c-type biogenesis protein CcmE [bacterium BMS3Abin09]GBE40787.1 cytochrome c-type biogenesis protein CcmE [bacterium BMS3Bbin09]HDO26174.1 cytochrome c maturation protein CcmE [Nitrospirota bacterium]
MKGRQITIVFSVLLIMAAFSYLVFLGMKEGSMYYLEVSELFEKLDEMGNGKVRVNGEIVPGSVNYDLAALTLNFTLKDKDIEDSPRLNVIYKGPPPDMLEQEGVTLVAEGFYNMEKRIFKANKLLVKCPSKYEKKEDEA